LTPKDEFLQARRILKVKWPRASGQRDGPAKCFTSGSDYQKAFYSGNLPLFVRGVTLDVIEDDGSPDFDHLYERVRSGGAGGIWE